MDRQVPMTFTAQVSCPVIQWPRLHQGPSGASGSPVVPLSICSTIVAEAPALSSDPEGSILFYLHEKIATEQPQLGRQLVPQAPGTTTADTAEEAGVLDEGEDLHFRKDLPQASMRRRGVTSTPCHCSPDSLLGVVGSCVSASQSVGGLTGQHCQATLMRLAASMVAPSCGRGSTTLPPSSGGVIHMRRDIDSHENAGKEGLG